MAEKIGILVRVESGLGVLHQLTGVIAALKGDISSVAIVDSSAHEARIYFEVELPGAPETLLEGLQALPVVKEASLIDSLEKVYGKRIIVMGGGAQVGQVAIGAISEADRHNIRGEHISVDPIPLVGEHAPAAAVRACARLPRMKALVLAGSLMGGDIE